MIDDKKPQTLHTLSLKRLSPPASVWSKTTLNTGGVCGRGRGGPLNLKNGDIFSYVFWTIYANYQRFPI